MKKLKSCAASLTAVLAVCAVASHAVTDTVPASDKADNDITTVIQTETATEESTGETDPPMTGETKIVYEPDQKLLRRVNLSDVSVPKGKPAEATEAEITADEPVSDPETEAPASESTDTLTDSYTEDTSNVSEKAENNKQKKPDKPAIIALGSIAASVAVISAGAAIFRSAKKKRGTGGDSHGSDKKDGNDTGKN